MTDVLSSLERSPSGYLIVEDPTDAATALVNGAGVEYCPGDGTRYVCLVVSRAAEPNADPRQWLAVENFKLLLLLDGSYTLQAWCRSREVPTGSWSALRPLLKALGVLAPGPVKFMRRDAQDEYKMRLTIDGEPYNEKDARLGRIVRNAVKSEVTL